MARVQDQALDVALETVAVVVELTMLVRGKGESGTADRHRVPISQLLSVEVVSRVHGLATRESDESSTEVVQDIRVHHLLSSIPRH